MPETHMSGGPIGEQKQLARASTTSRYAAPARITVMFLLLTAAAWMLAGCGGDDEKAVAAEVATAWVDSSIDEVSQAVAELVIDEEPAVASLAAGALSGLVRESLSWDYSDPVRLREGRYTVTATATADVQVKIPLVLDARYVATLPFNLEVDTGAKSVSSWLPDPGSATVESR